MWVLLPAYVHHNEKDQTHSSDDDNPGLLSHVWLLNISSAAHVQLSIVLKRWVLAWNFPNKNIYWTAIHENTSRHIKNHQKSLYQCPSLKILYKVEYLYTTVLHLSEKQNHLEFLLLIAPATYTDKANAKSEIHKGHRAAADCIPSCAGLNIWIQKVITFKSPITMLPKTTGQF